MFHLKGLVHKKMVQCPSLPLRFSSRFILRLERRGKQKAAENLLQTHYLVYSSIIKLIIRKSKNCSPTTGCLVSGGWFLHSRRIERPTGHRKAPYGQNL